MAFHETPNLPQDFRIDIAGAHVPSKPAVFQHIETIISHH
jgi:hypothetical protein